MHLPFPYVVNMLQLNNSFKSFGVRSKVQKGKEKNKLILRHSPTVLYFYTWIFRPPRTYKAVQTKRDVAKNSLFRFWHFFFLINSLILVLQSS